MGVFDAFDGPLGIASDAPEPKLLMYLGYIAILVVFVVQTVLSIVYWTRQVGASLQKKANRYIYVFQTPEYQLGNGPSASFRASGSVERWLIYLMLALFAFAFVAGARCVFVLRHRQPTSFALFFFTAALFLYAGLQVLIMVPGYWSASRSAQRQLLMRTLFNNAVFNSVSLDPSVLDALVSLGPSSALEAVAASVDQSGRVEGFADVAASADTPDGAAAATTTATNALTASMPTTAQLQDGALATEASAAAAVSQGADKAKELAASIQSSVGGVLSSVETSVWSAIGPGFARLYRGLYDFANGVSRETVIAPLSTSGRVDAWVGALVAMNLYAHVARNVPRDDPLFESVMAVFSADDYERRAVDYYSYFAFGEYNVIDNLAPSYRASVPADISALVLRRVHQRMAIINGLCDKATTGLVGGNDVYNAYMTTAFYSAATPLILALLVVLFLQRVRARVFECPPVDAPPASMGLGEMMFDMFTPVPPHFIPSAVNCASSAR